MVSVGQLLRDRRDALSLLPHEVAERARVSEGALVAFEESRGKLTAAALDRVAEVLAVDALALRDGRIEPRPTATLFFQQFRTFADFRDVEDQPKVAEALARAGNLLDLNAMLGRPPSLRARFEPAPAPAEAAKDGYRLAMLVRRALGNELEPLPDLVLVLEDAFDILVRYESLSSTRVDALTVKDSERGTAAVILNRASERRANPRTARVDLAHELAHVLFDPANERVNLVVDMDDKESRDVNLAEKRARAFAAELLMPAEGLRHLLGIPRYEMSVGDAMAMVDRVREAFMTPIEIAVNHLVNRDYVWFALQRTLIEQARSGERPAAPLPASVTRPDVLERRVSEALDRDLITNARARELLGLTPWDDLPVRA